MTCVNKTTGKIIYMDNAASTRLNAYALGKMMPFLTDEYANPGGVYDHASGAARAVAKARHDIAYTIGAEPNEIYFTCGGTEADNWALMGAAALAGTAGRFFGYRNTQDIQNPHIITSSFEHHAVLNTCRYLETLGVKVSYVNPSGDGIIPVSAIEKQICSDTMLISIMLANNETGTIQPVKEIGKLARDKGILFHTDAVAAYGHIPIDVDELNIDLMSVSAHKLNGPKGVGFLYMRGSIKLPPFMHGGAQEQGRRAGTVNVPGVVGMASAAICHHDEMAENLRRVNELGDHFMHRLEAMEYRIGGRSVRINGSIKQRLPGSFNIIIEETDAEELLVRLGMEGICISAGAACASSQGTSSHVLKALGLTAKEAGSSVRITMNEENTEEEIDVLFETLNNICNKR